MVIMAAMIAALLSSILMMLLLIYARQVRRRDIFYRLRRYELVDVAGAAEGTDFFARLRNFLTRLAAPIAERGSVQALDFRMRQAGIPLLGGEFMILLFGSAALVGIITLMLTLDVTTAFLMGTMMAMIIWFTVSIRVRRRRNAFTEQLGDCLTTIANALRAGYSFQQAMEVVAREMEPPLSDEFEQVNREVAMSVPLETALEAMNNRVGSGDLDLVVTAVLVQREVGGNLAQILDTISDTIQERIRMKREILSLTAQGRMSAWVLILLPFGLAFFVYLFNKEQFMVLFSDPIGRMAVVASFVLEIIGYLVIQRIVNIDV